jgi:hypothetical protein
MLDDAGQLDPRQAELDVPSADAADVEKIVDQTHEVRQLPLRHGPDPADRLGAGAGLLHHLETGPQRRQRVAELVRKHGEELVLPPGGVAERVLGAPAVGDVDAGRLHLGRPPVLVERQAPVRPERPPRAVGRVEAILDPDCRRLRAQLVEHPANRGLVVLHDEVPEVDAGQRVGRRAEGARISAVREQDGAIRPESADHLRLPFDDRAIPRFAGLGFTPRAGQGERAAHPRLDASRGLMPATTKPASVSSPRLAIGSTMASRADSGQAPPGIVPNRPPRPATATSPPTSAAWRNGHAARGSSRAISSGLAGPPSASPIAPASVARRPVESSR